MNDLLDTIFGMNDFDHLFEFRNINLKSRKDFKNMIT